MGDHYVGVVYSPGPFRELGTPLFTTSRVRAWRETDGTLIVEHVRSATGEDPWDMSSITESFATALRDRRRRQGHRMLRSFGDVLGFGPVLDYGCGQQAFLSQLLAAGHDATGTDVGIPGAGVAEGVPNERFIRLDTPWAVPRPGTWTTVVLLDVLEHHHEPTAFLGSLGGPRFLVVKVPLLTGPIARLASAGIHLGRPALMETLLLVDDVSPHLRFFTPAGLDRVARDAGYERCRRLNLADVGNELPDRIRGGMGPRSRPARAAASAIGAGFAAIAPLWADTAAFLYERAPSSAG